ncbi:MAG: helix-turn-helix domain-containing protein [Bacteroidota bacterium]
MLTVIQIVAILQGLFLGFSLYQRKHEYKNPIFWIFMGCIVSVILFAIGDDDYNLLVDNANWVFFHEPLMITFFFLFIRYSGDDNARFDKFDLLFFLPFCINLIIEALLLSENFEGNFYLQAIAELIEIGFIAMLFYCIYDVIKNKKEKWLLAFLIPFSVIFVVDEIAFLFFDSTGSILSLDSYGIILFSVFLFYFVTYKLIIAPKDVLPSNETKYKSSNLSKAEAESIEKELNNLLKEEKIFKNQKIDANEVAAQLGITRQRLSEVLNVHMSIRFQDLLNKYRVEEFIKCLHNEDYKNYTLLGIATEVGFSSKSSFNSTFKKIMGLTPSQYKKQKMEV